MTFNRKRWCLICKWQTFKLWWLYWTLISWQERFRFLDWIYVRSSILKIFLKRPNINPGEDSLKGDKVDLCAIWLMARANKFYISHHSARAPLVRRLNTLFIFSQQNFFGYILIKKISKAKSETWGLLKLDVILQEVRRKCAFEGVWCRLLR